MVRSFLTMATSSSLAYCFFFLPTTYRIVSLIRELGNLFVCVLICLFGGSIKTLSLMTWVDVVCYWICIKGVIVVAYRYLILSFLREMSTHLFKQALFRYKFCLFCFSTRTQSFIHKTKQVISFIFVYL